jgi:outer membrane protein TolC
MRILTTAVLAALFGTTLGATPSASAVAASGQDSLKPPNPLTISWCLDRAAAANAGIAVGRAASDAARERIVTAGALDDPRFRYELSNIPIGDWDFDSTPLSGHQLGLHQKIPFPGMLSNRRGAARAGAAAADLSLEEQERRVAGAVESAWAQLGFAQRALEITERNVELLRRLTRIAEAKYRVGTGLQQDVLRAQVELTVLIEQRLRREAEIARAGATLAALLDLPPEMKLPKTTELDDASRLPILEDLLIDLEERSPELRAQTARIEEAQRLREAAKFEGYPGFDFDVGYRIRRNVRGDPVNGDDFVGAGVTIRLPVNRARWKAQVAERDALWRREKAALRGARADLRAQIRSVFAELRRADLEIQLLETGLVPQARQSLESSRSGYEVGRIGFLSLLDSQVRLLETELRRVRAAADRRVAFAALEAAAGETLR